MRYALRFLLVICLAVPAFAASNVADLVQKHKGLTLGEAKSASGFQYWGHAVKAVSQEDIWIQEAFAEYSSALFMKEAGRPNDYNRAFGLWKSAAKDESDVTNIPMATRLVNPGDPYSLFAARNGLVYSKGAYLLAALHRELGDEQFLTFLKSYQRSFRGKYATTADVMGLLQFMTKKDYAPFFEQYYYGMAVPDVKK